MQHGEHRLHASRCRSAKLLVRPMILISRVDRHARRLCFGDERLGALGIERTDLQVADSSRSSRAAPSRSPRYVLRTGSSHEGLAVDGEVQRLADAPVVERRDLRVDAHDRRSPSSDRRNRSPDWWRPARRCSGRCRPRRPPPWRRHRHVGAEHVGRLLNLRLLAPVVLVARQDDVLAGVPFAEDVGPGADGLADEGVRVGAGRDDGQRRHQQRQDRLRRIRRDLERRGVDRLRSSASCRRNTWRRSRR